MKTLICALIAAAGCAGSLHAENRSYDGSGNNVGDWFLGSTGDQLFRLGDAVYADGLGEMISWRPSPRAISNTVGQQQGSGNQYGLSAMFWQWGQFIDHDFALVGEDESTDAAFAIPQGDPWFDPTGTGTQVMHQHRSAFVEGETGPRQYENAITHFIDGSMVYGSDDVRAADLRSFSGGRLRMGENGLLAGNTNGLPNAGGTDPSLFIAGDIRANEQAGLTAMHTVFNRHHNAVADQLAADNPSWDDEQLYQMARKIVGAQIQKITYEEWLPAFLGEDALSEYAGYDDSVDPRLSLEFTTAAFRFGHTMLNDTLPLMQSDGSIAGSLSLAEAFFNPSAFSSDPSLVDQVLGGLTTIESNEVDTRVIDGVRNLLFGAPGSGGLDLMSLNINRGRDHGIDDYNSLRVSMGLDAVLTFDQITSDTALADDLESLYGNVDDIDAWVGLVAEDHLAGAAIGETLWVIFVDQFERLRDGDRFFYLNDQELVPYLDLIGSTTLGSILQSHLDIGRLQSDVFFVPGPGAGVLAVCALMVGRSRRRSDHPVRI